MDRRVIWPERVTPPTGAPPPSREQALNRTTVANAILLVAKVNVTRYCQKTKDREAESEKIIRNPVIAQRKKKQHINLFNWVLVSWEAIFAEVAYDS